MGDIREVIPVEVSKLFTGRGYFGTSTRDIARAVGIRRPLASCSLTPGTSTLPSATP
jgi:hypothetical protein